jgi:hypothetical protein
MATRKEKQIERAILPPEDSNEMWVDIIDIGSSRLIAEEHTGEWGTPSRRCYTRRSFSSCSSLKNYFKEMENPHIRIM